MKSYNHLYEQYISEENCKLALWNGTKNKSTRRKKCRARKLRRNKNIEIPKILKYAKYENFHNYHHKPVQIYDGIRRKVREIIVPNDHEQVVHHMIVNVLKPILLPKFYEHSYGSIPGRGSHKAKKAIKKWIKHDPKNVKYCLKMDIKKYFNNVNHDILKQMFRKLIHDEKFLSIVFRIIDVIPGNKGIPLGFYTSQWIANMYLTGLDHYIKEVLKVKHYVRYMDDMVIFSSNKKYLHRVREAISRYLNAELDLELKENWQVFRFDYIDPRSTIKLRFDNVITAEECYNMMMDYVKKGPKKDKHLGRDLDFMGFRFFRDRVILRKSIMLKSTRKAKRIGKKRKPTIYDCRQILSYLGWIKATDVYDMYKKYIKPYIDFRRCKRYVSKCDKLKSKIQKLNQMLYNSFFPPDIDEIYQVIHPEAIYAA